MSSLEHVKAHTRRGKHGMEYVREYDRPTGEKGNIVFDFDGVLHEHRGYTWPPGHLDFSGIDKAHERGYSAGIVTANDPPLIARELKARGYHVALDPSNQTWYWNGGEDGHTILVTGRKLDGKAYIDDKAINHMFGDDWDHTLDQVGRLRQGMHPIEQGEDHAHFQHSHGPTGQESRLSAGMPGVLVWLTTPEMAVVELTNVKGYRRMERGKLENVRSYVTRRVARYGPSQAEMRKAQSVAMGGGKKFHKLNGRFVDAEGGVHWGWYGGAGLLIHHTDEGGKTRYLLQKRAGGVMQGGTWSTPGGAIDKVGGLVETPVKTAFREALEEWGPMPRDLTVTGVTTKSFGEAGKPGHWTYHTVHAESPQMFVPPSLAKDKKGKWLHEAASHGGESAGYGWFTPKEMTKLDLHPDFRETAIKHLGMPDVPPPKPKYGYQQAGGYGFGWNPQGWNPQATEWFKKGERVTWRYQGQTIHGEVVSDKGEARVNVKSDEDGKVYPVDAYGLWHEHDAEPQPGPVFPPGTSLAQQAQAEKVGSRKQHYPPDDRVTWRYHGQTMHGTVLGNAAGEESSKQPVAYQVRSDDGATVEVPWSGLRLEAEPEPHQHKPPTVIKGQALTQAQKAKAKQPFPQAVQQARFSEPPKPAKPKKAKPPPPPPKGSVLAKGSSTIHGYVMPGIQRPSRHSLTLLKTPQRIAQEKGKRYAAEKPPPGRNYALRRGQALRRQIEQSTRNAYVR